MSLALAGFWHYLALTLPIALAVWGLIEWRQRRRRPASPRCEPTFEEAVPEPVDGCPHPRFKRVHVRRNGVNVPTDEMQCVQCRQRMRA